MKIQNPILKGFNPDPSIIRVGKDYYIATSTFEWWPGVKLFHSRDLVNWEQIPSPLRRESQLNMLGNPPSGGVWAPCLSYDGKRYYLVYTDVKTRNVHNYYNTHNYVIYTDDIYGEWSEPVYLNSVGFDPSLFHDNDGRKYLVNMLEGFKGITIQELDAETLKPVEERRLIYSGSGLRCTEGPHIYHIGDRYYLIVAEGGTGYEHCVTMARSESLFGPYVTAPGNPILTSDRADLSKIQKCGHADITDTPDGEWYMVHLCSRPIEGERLCPLGRETAIQKMYWDEEGWLRPVSGGNIALNETEAPKCAEGVSAEENIDFFDDFNEDRLSECYCSPRWNYNEFADCKSHKGYLRLTGRESINSLHRVSLVAVRQQCMECAAETAISFKPKYHSQLAGITYMYDALNFYIFGKTVLEDGAVVLVLRKGDNGVITDAVEPVRLDNDSELKLRIVTCDGGRNAEFYYMTEGGVWQQAGGKCTAEILTDEYCRGFTGAHFGMYCHDMADSSAVAEFDYFSVKAVH